jgi:cell division protease FtsH
MGIKNLALYDEEFYMNTQARFPSSNTAPKQEQPARRPNWSFPGGSIWLIFLVVLALNYLLGKNLFPDPSAPANVSYTLFKKEVEKSNVSEIYSKGLSVTGTFKNKVTVLKTDMQPADSVGLQRLQKNEEDTITAKTFATELPSFLDNGLESLLIKKGVVIRSAPIQEERNPILSFLVMFGPALLIIGFYIWMFRKAGQGGSGGLGGFMGIGSSKAKRFDKEQGKKVTFDDVAGIDEARNELVEIVDFLRNPKKYTRLGGTAPKGVLLIGAPGTGKTLLARAVAGEAGVPFFSMSASEFVEMIVGVGAARVRDLFKQARENAPAIIFIDELDAIGRARGTTAIGAAGEQEQTLNQILTEMDGFSTKEGVIVLSATNQPDVLDKALLRPGRFDRRVVVNVPDKNGREQILKVHTRKVPLGKSTNLQNIASVTPGLTGADLRNLVNEAALMAARRNQDAVEHKDFMDALEKIVLGPERSLLLSAEERERIAYHEGGHAILGLVVPGADPVNRVTIVPRGQALGVTYQRPESDRYNYSEEYLRAKIIGILGGRSAEEIVFGSKTTGAENDIDQATNLARSMVTRWGMSEQLGMIQLDPKINPYLGTSIAGATGMKPFSESTAQAIDDEVRKIINECHDEAKRLLEEHRYALDNLAHALLSKETLNEKEILEVTGLSPVKSAKKKSDGMNNVTANRRSQTET